MVILFYVFFLICTAIYSYALVDPNLTLINHPVWVIFRDQAVELGYYHRDISWILYLACVILLFIFHYYFLRRVNKFKPFNIALIVGSILLFSYPFLSHDFFNYLFDAKILTYYHQNPYTHSALDFSKDHWVRFMHWTHRTYPYGPSFLILSLIPSFLSAGKFILAFVFFKILFIGSYIFAVKKIAELNKKWAIVIATHPLIIIEGLINTHNDLLGLTFGLMGIYFLLKDRKTWSRFLFVISVLVKYINVPVLFVSKNKSSLFTIGSFFLQVGVLVYFSLYQVIQPWYFMSIFAFVPWFETIISRFNIFFFGLLVSYYPYIFLGGWDTDEKVLLKKKTIITFLAINLIFLLFEKKIRSFLRGGILFLKARILNRT